MILVLGGRAQGQLEYVKNHYDKIDAVVYEPDMSLKAGMYVFDKVNEYVYSSLKEGQDYLPAITSFVDKYKDIIVISDEVGNGIVPMDQFQRNYREEIGRLQIMLAEKADRVVRIVCGIEQILK